jgi:hypothetical protein
MTVTAGRSHPFLSRFGCLATLVILAGVGIAVLVSGGAVFNPGRLTARAETGAPLGGLASHAAFENDCGQCHMPFRGVEAARCETCHTDIAAQRSAGRGLHGVLQPAAVARCAQCHTDHKGRDFNPSVVTLASLDQAGFDHVATGFALTTHLKNYDGSPLACRACHLGDNYSVAEQTCTDCHRNAYPTFMDEHVQTFGSNCLGCHDGTGSLANFDHRQFFPLEGAHAAVECTACHVNRQFKGTPTECAACHAEPEVHAGLLGTDCAACHRPTAWKPAALANHTFPLDHGEQGLLACSTCHPAAFREYTCFVCHEHDPTEIASNHAEKGITGSRLLECAVCHPTGRTGDDN